MEFISKTYRRDMTWMPEGRTITSRQRQVNTDKIIRQLNYRKKRKKRREFQRELEV
jgi:hypothetical protein